MKVFKSKQQSVLPKPFAVSGKLYLAVGVLVFFALDEPDSLLSEQELWDTVPKLIGNPPILDQGLPKPRGEVLVSGDCFAPKGQPVQGLNVSLSAGAVHKELQVMGDRHWKTGTITDPKPFVRMPLNWERAFGGSSFEKNPLGKGAEKVTLEDGSKILPLPNIEYAQKLIGSPHDKPEPAGFGPLDLLWPQRQEKCGTYDQQWLEKHWPYFPEDMNFEFFNAAPEDQFLDGFFQGGENIQLQNMHAEHALLNSHVPKIRMRVFASMNPDFKQHVFPSYPLPSQQMSENEEFREISTRMDTLWLFPNIMRGLAIFRGSTQVLDEEYEDVLRLFVAEESLEDKPKSLQWYLEEQKRLLNRSVQVDMAPFEKAAQTYAQGQRKVRNIPKQLDAMRKSFLGKSPVMPAREPEEMLEQNMRTITALRNTVDSQEQMARDLMGRLGPFSGVDMGIFGRKRKTLDRMESKARSTVDSLSKTKKKLLSSKGKALEQKSQSIEKVNKRLASRPETAHLQVPEDKSGQQRPAFHQQGFPLLASWYRVLIDQEQPQAAIKNLGLERNTLKRHWVGYNPEEVTIEAGEFGAETGQLTLPAGFVLPRFQERELTGLLIRPWRPETGQAPEELKRGASDVRVPGSEDKPLFLPSATLIDLPALPAKDSAPLVRVADEFQALFVEQEVGDFCSVIAMADAQEKPDKEAAEQLKKAEPAIVVLPATANENQELQAWKAIMPEALAFKLKHGASVFEDRAKGEDIRKRILEFLPAEEAAKQNIALELPEAGKPPEKGLGGGMKFPFPDLGAVIPGLISEIRSVYQAKFDKLKAETLEKQNEVLTKAREAAKKTEGLNPEDIQIKEPGQRLPLSQRAREMAEQVRQSIVKLKEKNVLSPEKEEELKEQAKSADKMAQFAEQKEKELAAKKEELEKGLGNLKARKLPGQDEEEEQYPSLSREEVQERYESGRSLAGTRLQGLDLSGMDLSGADFSNCLLTGTKFKQSKLNGAKFKRVLARETDFSGALLQNAVLDMGIFNKACFVDADLSAANCNQVAFSESDLSGTKLNKAFLYLCSLEKAVADKADLAEACCELSMLPGSVKEANFKGSRLTRCVFKETALDGAVFSGATLERTLFQGARGKGLDFKDANLERVRSMKNSELTGADFSGADLRRAGLRDTDLSEAVFRDCDMGGALLEKCRLVRADFYHLKAVRTRFSKCNLESANMRGANLFMASLRKSRLVQTDLTGSNLYGVDFYKAVVGKTVFDAANLKKSMLEKRIGLLEEKKQD
jgi:uncharacterized protein YjbI with pentapeptide repeats